MEPIDTMIYYDSDTDSEDNNQDNDNMKIIKIMTMITLILQYTTNDKNS